MSSYLWESIINIFTYRREIIPPSSHCYLCFFLDRFCIPSKSKLFNLFSPSRPFNLFHFPIVPRLFPLLFPQNLSFFLSFLHHRHNCNRSETCLVFWPDLVTLSLMSTLFLPKPASWYLKTFFTSLYVFYAHFISFLIFHNNPVNRYDPFEKCSVRNCEISYKNDDVGSADIVIIHLHRTKGLGDLPPTNGRKKEQIWAFLTDENPYHTFLAAKISLKDFDGIFNWSITYR